VAAQLSADRKTVVAIHASGPGLNGYVEATNAGKIREALRLPSLPSEGDPGADRMPRSMAEAHQ
jgi:hypothetical protein